MDRIRDRLRRMLGRVKGREGPWDDFDETFDTSSLAATEETAPSVSDTVPSVSETSSILSVEIRQIPRENHCDTENDAIIAAILAEGGDLDDEAVTIRPRASSVHMHQPFGSEEEISDEAFEAAMAIAIVQSLDEAAQDMANVTLGPPLPPPAPERPAAPPPPPAPSCPICTHELAADHESGEIEGEQPLRAFCPECIHAFHNACLAQWFKQGRDTIVCPMCRRVMEADFVEEVTSS